MPKIHVKKSIFINKPANVIFPVLNDFSNWQPWSPWLIADPDATVTVQPSGKAYSWEGKITGSGEMDIANEIENQHVDYNLRFLKPWKSKAKTYFDLKEKDGGTEVTWTMDSSLPFFMFFMKKMMVAYIGMDYERGLLMLKDYVEDGEVHSKLEFKGTTTYNGCQYIGIRTQGAASEIEQLMTSDFERLMQYVYPKQQDNIAGEGFSIYHKFDPVKDKVDYTVGMPLKSIPAGLPSGLISGSVPMFKGYTIRHTGSYKHAGNVWSAQVMHQRNKQYKVAKKPHPMEIYYNSPKDTPENDLITDVIFAEK